MFPDATTSPDSVHSPLAPVTRIPVCLDVPKPVRDRLLYATEELLRPLAAAPVLVAPGDLGESGIYVGPTPEEQSVGAIRIRHRAETAAVLLGRQPVSPEAAAWMNDAPLPFPLGVFSPLASASEIVEIEPFASAFWWLAGIQEHARTPRDRWGRVPYAESLQAHVDRPLATPVDALRSWLADALRARGWSLSDPSWSGASWAIALTHDLDATRTRRLRAAFGDAARGRPLSALRRGLGPDARTRSARALADLARRHGARSTVFAKAGESGPEDVVSELRRDAAWLGSLAAEGFEIGLHPSIQASTDAKRLRHERQRLEEATGQPLAAVRSHYLRWDSAVTPALYAAEGFAMDSTLGWAETPGFRRGSAHPFRLWDHASGQPSSLWEMPLAVMDTTLFEHQSLGPESARAALEAVLMAARKSNGLAVLLWHNAMEREGLWRQRLGILDDAIGRAVDSGAALVTLGEAHALARAGGL